MDNIFPALNLIRRFEGCRLTAYTDMVGRLTIGWGTAHGVTEGQQITQEEADQMLRSDCEQLAAKIKQMVHADLTDNALCALISFAYNLGIGNLFHSTLLTKLNSDTEKSEIAAEFLKWDHAGGKVVAGLTARRTAESELFLS